VAACGFNLAVSGIIVRLQTIFYFVC